MQTFGGYVSNEDKGKNSEVGFPLAIPQKDV